MDTARLLIEQHGTRDIPVDRICAELLGLTPAAARNAIRLGRFPLPTYRLGGRKSPLLVSVDDLAELLDRRREQAREAHRLRQMVA